MRIYARRAAVLALAVFIAFACAGCMTASVEELYSLPQMSEQYVQLQELIGQRIADGGSYAAPIGGSNRQSIQLRDLDGDGTAEALAFLADDARTPMVCVYRQNGDGTFYLFLTITGEGSAVASLDYADLTGDGASELIIAWQIGGDIRLLSVYALNSTDQIQLLRADCSEFVVCDLDGDGIEDLLDLRMSDSGAGSLVMYSLLDQETSSSSAALSSGVTGVRRAVAGLLSDGAAALFVESDLGQEGMVTDVFTASGGQVRNITMSALGRSDTLRPRDVFGADLTGDGVMDLPVGSGEMLSWYDVNSAGQLYPTASTYYNAEDGWYFVLSDELRDRLDIERHGALGEEHAVVFSMAGDESSPQRSIFVIYTLVGANRMDRATVDGRFILRQEEDVVYAAQLLTDELTQQDIRESFYIIYDQWQTGDL